MGARSETPGLYIGLGAHVPDQGSGAGPGFDRPRRCRIRARAEAWTWKNDTEQTAHVTEHGP